MKTMFVTHEFIFSNVFDISYESYNIMVDLMSGMKQTISCVNQSKGGVQNSVNSPMSLASYKNMCHSLILSHKSEVIFAHYFLTLEWSMMK